MLQVRHHRVNSNNNIPEVVADLIHMSSLLSILSISLKKNVKYLEDWRNIASILTRDKHRELWRGGVRFHSTAMKTFVNKELFLSSHTARCCGLSWSTQRTLLNYAQDTTMERLLTLSYCLSLFTHYAAKCRIVILRSYERIQDGLQMTSFQISWQEIQDDSDDEWIIQSCNWSVVWAYINVIGCAEKNTWWK